MIRVTTSVLMMFCLLMAAGAAAAAEDPSGGYVQQVANGQIDWQKGYVTAVGIGAPPANPVNMAQARAMAERAATVVARRNLLEVVKGVQIDSATLVENYMVTNDVVVSQVNGFIQSSQILDTAYMSDGSVEVTVGLSLRGELTAVILPPTGDLRHARAPPLRPRPASGRRPPRPRRRSRPPRLRPRQPRRPRPKPRQRRRPFRPRLPRLRRPRPWPGPGCWWTRAVCRPGRP